VKSTPSTTTTTANNNTPNNSTASNVNTSTRATSGPQASPAGSQHAHSGSGQTHTAGTLRGPGYVNPDSQTVDDYGSYVDQYPGLTNAWNLINAYNTGGDLSAFSNAHGMTPAEQAQYWNTRMGGAKYQRSIWSGALWRVFRFTCRNLSGCNPNALGYRCKKVCRSSRSNHP
jgi:hypothetical protein